MVLIPTVCLRVLKKSLTLECDSSADSLSIIVHSGRMEDAFKNATFHSDAPPLCVSKNVERRHWFKARDRSAEAIGAKGRHTGKRRTGSASKVLFHALFHLCKSTPFARVNPEQSQNAGRFLAARVRPR